MLIEAARSASNAGYDTNRADRRRAKTLLRADDADQRFSVDVTAGVGSLLAGDARQAVPLLRGTRVAASSRVHADSSRPESRRLPRGRGHQLGLYWRAATTAREEGGVGTLPYVLYLARAEGSADATPPPLPCIRRVRLASETGQQNSICHMRHRSRSSRPPGTGGRLPSACCSRRWRKPVARAGYQAALAGWASLASPSGSGARPSPGSARADRRGRGPGRTSLREARRHPTWSRRPWVADGASTDGTRRVRAFRTGTAPPWAWPWLRGAAGCSPRDRLPTTISARPAMASRSARLFDRARTEPRVRRVAPPRRPTNEARTQLRAALEASGVRARHPGARGAERAGAARPPASGSERHR